MAEERAQRRFAAILAANVVGNSQLMERGETEIHARLRSLRSQVFDPRTKQFDDRIFKNTGDGGLAELAAPLMRSNAQLGSGARSQGGGGRRAVAFVMCIGGRAAVLAYPTGCSGMMIPLIGASIPHELSKNHQALDIVGPLVDATNPHVAIEPLDRKIR